MHEINCPFYGLRNSCYSFIFWFHSPFWAWVELVALPMSCITRCTHTTLVHTPLMRTHTHSFALENSSFFPSISRSNRVRRSQPACTHCDTPADTHAFSFVYLNIRSRMLLSFFKCPMWTQLWWSNDDDVHICDKNRLDHSFVDKTIQDAQVIFIFFRCCWSLVTCWHLDW